MRNLAAPSSGKQRKKAGVVEKALQKYSRMINQRRDKIGWVEEAKTVIGVPNGERAAAFELPVR
jgi:hypothetical protein